MMMSVQKGFEGATLRLDHINLSSLTKVSVRQDTKYQGASVVCATLSPHKVNYLCFGQCKISDIILW